MVVSSSLQAAEYLTPPPDRVGGNISNGVVATGGKTVYLSGHSGDLDAARNPVAGAEAQARRTFEALDATLKRAGGSLANMVMMTIMIRDNNDRATVQKVRDGMFKAGNYPATTFLYLTGLPRPTVLVHINGIAVIE